MEKSRLPDVYVQQAIADAVHEACKEHGLSYAAFLRQALRNELVRLADTRTCPGCGMARPVLGSFEDGLAHAQCDQRMARIEEEAK